MTQYRVTFERIGRNHNVAPLVTKAEDGEALALRIEKYARPHLRSRDVEVAVNLAGGSGYIICGMHNGGEFAIAEVD